MIQLAVAAMLPVAALMQGCEHKDLCYDHSHMTDLRVDFDWSAAPDAEPGTMVVHFFPSRRLAVQARGVHLGNRRHRAPRGRQVHDALP